MKRNFTFLIAALALLTFLAVPMGMWGQTKITDYSNIVSGNTYYIGATTGGTDYYLYVYHDYNSTSTAGTAKTSMNDATTFIFEGSGSSWTIKFDNGKYLSLKNSQDNGKVQVVTDPATFTASNQSGSKIRLSKGSYSVQKNNTGTQFGSYGNTQTDIWLMEVPSGLSLTTVTIDDSGISNTDVHTSIAAGSLSATVTENTNNTVVSGATVTWSSSNENVATIASDGSVTLVAEGSTTITAYYAGVSGEYGESSATYELNVSDSTPFAGGDVTFVAGTDLGSTTSNADGDQMIKKVVTVSSTSAAFATAEYRLYSGSSTTISTSFGTITAIEFTKNGNYSLGNLSTETGSYTSSNGTWIGNASSVTFAASAQVRLDQIVVTVTPPSSSVATTVTIDDTNLTNTDVYLGAAAGSLSATVIENDNNTTISGATVTWSGDNDAVATINATTGVVNLVGVGTVTFTASYAGVEDEYQASSATYELTVTSSAPYVQPTEFEIGLNNTLFGTSHNGPVSSITEANPIVGSQDNVTVTYAGSGNHYVNDSQIRFYPNNKLTFEAPLGYVITEIVFTSAGTWAATISADNGTYTTGTKTWTGSASSVLFTGSGSSRCDMSKATITLALPAVAYSITYPDNLANGAFAATGNPTSAYEGDNVTVTTTPAQNYHLSRMTYNYGETSVEATISGNTGSFTMPGNAVTMYAEFALDVTYTINYSFNGTIINDFTETVTEATLWNSEYVETFVTEYTTLSELGFTFVGWTTDPSYTTVVASYTPSANTTLYAVLEKEGATNHTITLNKNTENFPAAYGTANLFTEYKLEGENFMIQQVYVNNNLLQFRAYGNSNGTGTIYNSESLGTITSIVLNYAESDNNKNFTINAGSTANPTSGTSITPTVDNLEYTFDLSQGNYSFFVLTNGSNAGYLESIVINYSASETTYCTRVYTKEITGYGHNTTGNWYLIASPIAGSIDPEDVGNLLGEKFSGDPDPVVYNYDLYRFNQGNAQELEWENHHNYNNFQLENGKGYLYANKNNVTLTFVGTPYSGTEKEVELAYTAGSRFAGWNLVGNPFTVDAYTTTSYYEINNGVINPNVASSGAIAPFTGVFVKANGTGQKVKFTTEEETPDNPGNIQMVLAQEFITRGGATLEQLDKAIVSFNEGSQLGKFYFGSQNANLYIPQGNEEYAIVSAEAQGEMPVNFVAHEDGTYTLSINPENVEMDYLHLIDNLTGNDIDLMVQPDYTFTARTTDYASRFRLVFSANNVNENTTDDSFAFIANGNLIVNGEGYLQVFDILGHQLYANQLATPHSSLLTPNFPTGVYVIRLTNGNAVKTQKIVVK